MTSGATLVQASPTTRTWLHRLRDQLPQLKYSEARYWAAFKTERRGGTVAYLNPSQQKLRVFLALHPREQPGLEPTPSTSSWAARFPAVFLIAGERDLIEARRLILKSHAAIGSSIEKNVASRPEYLVPEELLPEIDYIEGSARQVLVNAYERNRGARETCLRTCSYR